MRLGVLFSGGKDSTYACGRAMEMEEVVCLITVRPQNRESYMFHTPNIHWVRLQAEAAALPLIEVESEGIEEEELRDLARAVMLARDHHAIEGVVTGAILSVYQAARIQKICRDLDLWCFNPLWHTDEASYMQRLIDTGFHIIISGVFSAPFDESWLGKELDIRALRELSGFTRTHGITLTGEGGEYETFVLDAPFFEKRIQVEGASTEYHNYHGRYDITAARLVKK
ncbi:MAG: diphthine--ammonia ligase [Methanomicrobiales archaeon]|nr:diphthine--ammonia ligase [Methanomicrobiales archaeon]